MNASVEANVQGKVNCSHRALQGEILDLPGKNRNNGQLFKNNFYCRILPVYAASLQCCNEKSAEQDNAVVIEVKILFVEMQNSKGFYTNEILLIEINLRMNVERMMQSYQDIKKPVQVYPQGILKC